VRGAEHERAPFVRMADAYAAWFLPFTTLVAGAAWALSGEPVRALAVFVVATPCPLILAAPIAILSGVSRAARIGVVVKGGRAIEQLGRARTVLVDKTGTLTLGAPEIDAVVPLDRHAAEDVLRLAASLDQASAHVLAGALVQGARARGLRLVPPEAVVEEPGRGIEGRVDGRRVLVGGAEWLRDRGCRWDPATAPQEADGRGTVLVAVDGRPAGVVEMGDRVREDAAAAIADLRAAGVAHVAMVSGDSRPVAEAVARQVGIDEIFAERSPEGKLAVVRAMRLDPARRPVVMVGDGVNDAPALAIADVGVAMGAAGATVTAETADAVVTVDRIDRVAAAVGIGRRSLGIARQSVLVGMGLSAVAMGFAAGGALSPVAGALLQEGIDVAVILNALRALGPGHARTLVATGRGGRGAEPWPAAGG
jgi:heavy metal translocating P-type ATPase